MKHMILILLSQVRSPKKMINVTITITIKIMIVILLLIIIMK